MAGFQTGWKVSTKPGYPPENLAGFQTAWKVSRHPGYPSKQACFQTTLAVPGKFKTFQVSRFPNNLKNFQTTWKSSRKSIRFQDNVESFKTTWISSRKSGRLQDSLESFQTTWISSRKSGRFPDRNPYCAKLSRHSVKFPDNINWKLSGVFVWSQPIFFGNLPNNLEGSEAVKNMFKKIQMFRKIKQTDSQI